MIIAIIGRRTRTAGFEARDAVFLTTALLLFFPSRLVASDAWYDGGGFDGYDRRSASAGLYALCVHNASGATNVMGANAWLNGMLLATSNGETAVVRVYWGTSDGGTTGTGWGHTNEFGDIAEGQVLTTNVSIAPNAAYYYRFYATNAAGEGWACTSACFVTPGPPVLTAGVGAMPVGTTVAALHGNFITGVTAAIRVYWGQDTNAWSGTNDLGTRGQGAFETPVTGLIPGTPYYYRGYATNAYGEEWSDLVAFTTRVGEARFAGGAFDGYDRRSASAGFYALCVHNASGATNVMGANAWLNGMLLATSNGEAAAVRVYWGTSDGGTTGTGWGHTNEFGDIAEGQVLTTNVSIAPNAAYYYRFYATNAAGEGWACTSACFVTPGPPVLTAGVGATPVGTTVAALHGNFITGVTAAIRVYWGQDTNAWSGTNDLGTRGQGAFETPVAGLIPGALYYYRCCGTNAYGEGGSVAVAFTTRVGEARFAGGAFDGYDQCALQIPLRSDERGGILVLH